MPFRVTAAAVVIGALALSITLMTGLGVPPRLLLAWLLDHGGPVHAGAAGWLMGAPAVLVAAWLARRRTPWAWVAVCGLHLLVLTVAVARFPHLLPDGAWPVLAAIAGTGLASVVTVFPAPDGRRGS